MLAINIIIAIFGISDISEKTNTPPTRNNMLTISNLLQNDNFNLCIIGDSNSTLYEPKDTPNSILREWFSNKQFNNRYASTSKSFGVYGLTTNIPKGNWKSNRLLPQNKTQNGSSNFSASYVQEWVFEEDLDENNILIRIESSNNNDISNWLDEREATVILEFYWEPNSISSFKARTFRNNTPAEWVKIKSGKPYTHEKFEISIPNGSGNFGIELSTDNNCIELLNSSLILTYAKFSALDDIGITISSLGFSGYKVSDHATETKYTNEALSKFFEINGVPDIYLVLLGQNISQDEEENLDTIWLENYLQMINRFRKTSIKSNNKEPFFLLLSPWSTDDENNRFDLIPDLLYKLSGSNIKIGFINLHRLVGPYLLTKGNLVEYNGVHLLNKEAADFIFQSVWNEIILENQGQKILRVPNDYPTIQSAIDSCKANDRIELSTGIYREPTIHFTDPIEIWGGSQDSFKTIIDGERDKQIIRFNHNKLNDFLRIQDITITNGYSVEGGAIQSIGNLEIVNCNFLDNGENNESEGGAIQSNGNTVIQRSNFLNNKGVKGSACKAHGSLVINESTFINENQPIWHENGSIRFDNSLVSNCGPNTLINLNNIKKGIILNSELTNNSLINSPALVCNSNTWACIVNSTICNSGTDVISGNWKIDDESYVSENCLCNEDLNSDGTVNILDLLIIISDYGSTQETNSDLNFDGEVNTNDLLQVISNYGLKC